MVEIYAARRAAGQWTVIPGNNMGENNLESHKAF